MTTETYAKATLHQRPMHELKELAIISAYLYVTLGAVILMKAAVLHTEGIAFTPWGIAIVKAVVLGKFVLLGNIVHVGGRDISGPLIWPTLRRAFAFLVLLIVLTIIEEVVVGLFHHQSIAASLGELFGARLEETLAGYLIMLLVLIPFFAFRVLSEALGEGRLERMFFVARESVLAQVIRGDGYRVKQAFECFERQHSTQSRRSTVLPGPPSPLVRSCGARDLAAGQNLCAEGTSG